VIVALQAPSLRTSTAGATTIALKRASVWQFCEARTTTGAGGAASGAVARPAILSPTTRKCPAASGREVGSAM
jgi:hypothetical protein